MDREPDLTPSKTLAIAAAFLCLSSVAVAGSNAAAEHPLLQEPAQTAQTPTFRSAVTRVRVDTLVTDGDGNFVDDLAAEDFRLLEDGVVQEITGVQLVSAESGRVTNLGSRGSSGPAAEIQSAATLGAIVYFVDQPSLDQSDHPQLSEVLGGLFEGDGDLAIPRAMFMLSEGGALRQLAPLTTDRDVLRNAALMAIEAGPASESIFERMSREYPNMMKNALDVLNNAGSSPAKIRDVVRAAEQTATRDGEQARQRFGYTLRRLTELTHALSVMEGRTALVWISSGAIVTNSGPFGAFAATVQEIVAAEVSSSAQTTWSVPDPRVLDAMDTLVEAANTGNVSIYAIDPRPISELGSLGTRAAVGDNQVARALRRNIRPAYAQLTAPLSEVAASTGGRSFIGWSDLGRAFREQYVDSTRFYMLFYEPPEPHEDGEYHEIEVEVGVSGAEVRARPGYRELPALERRKREITAALTLPGSVVGRPVPARGFHRFAADGSPSIYLAIGLPGQEETVLGSWAPAFGTVDTRDGVDEQAIQQLGIPFFEVHAVAVSSAGGLGHEFHARVASEAAAGRQSAANSARFSPYIREFQVDPGVYDVRMFVNEVPGDRVGTARLAVEVPSSEDGWRMADPMLVAVDPVGGGIRPLLSSDARSGLRLAASVQVGGAASPQLVLAVRREGVEAPIIVAAPTELRPVSPGVHGGVLPLPSLEPGQYEVELKIVDLAAEQQAVRLLALRVLESG